MKQLRSTFFRRKVKKRVISRSFRIPKDIDRLLTEHARLKQAWQDEIGERQQAERALGEARRRLDALGG